MVQNESLAFCQLLIQFPNGSMKCPKAGNSYYIGLLRPCLLLEAFLLS
uniref:Uncharacterized protein n=1 Tax=Arundo donax TaxID=35708 RepID=A0A0A9R4F0_ARUDO